MLPFAILWSIWKGINDRIFQGAYASLLELIEVITLRVAKWALLRREFSNFSLNAILLN